MDMTLVDDMETPRSARFWDKIARKYAKRPVPDADVYETKLRITETHLRPDMEVLEFACGTGTTALRLAPQVAHYRATDISAEMIAIAREKAWDQSIKSLRFERESFEEAPLERERYDVILGHSILHLLRDPDEVAKKVEAMLKPGGVFISSTTCIADFMPVFRFVAPLGRAIGVFPYVNIFGLRTLKAHLQGAGFALERVWQPNPKSAVFIVARKAA